MILYVRKNEDTSNVKLIHCYRNDLNDIPSELESNYKSELLSLIKFEYQIVTVC